MNQKVAYVTGGMGGVMEGAARVELPGVAREGTQTPDGYQGTQRYAAGAGRQDVRIDARLCTADCVRVDGHVWHQARRQWRVWHKSFGYAAQAHGQDDATDHDGSQLLQGHKACVVGCGRDKEVCPGWVQADARGGCRQRICAERTDDFWPQVGHLNRA